MKTRIENLIVGFHDRAVTADSSQQAYALISQEYSDRQLRQDTRQALSFTLLFETGEFSELELPYSDWQANFPSHEAFERRFAEILLSQRADDCEY
jgi:hypothetical protein